MERPNWDSYAFKLIEVIKIRSQDPNTKVGCVILDSTHRVVSTGYNSLPSGLEPDQFSMERPDKYKHVVHADMNAILSAERHRLIGATMYVPFLPCCECSKAIIQSGISRVVYNNEYTIHDERGDQYVGQQMMLAAGIKVEFWHE